MSEPIPKSQGSKPQGKRGWGIELGVSRGTGSHSIQSAKEPGPVVSRHAAVLMCYTNKVQPKSHDFQLTFMVPDG